MEYVEEYLQYLMTDKKAENELYTYGERLTNPKVCIKGLEYSFDINPVQEVIGSIGNRNSALISYHGDWHAF
jgi:hypothetical protein